MYTEGMFNFFYSKLLSKNTKKSWEKIIIGLAIISFIVHLIIIGLVHQNVLHFSNYSYLFSNPIAAIYTPFSFILVYEVYLLVYYLPKSTSIYIGKQYEIITLIVIRRVFKDLSQIEFTSNWFNVKSDIQFSYDLLATLILFFLIFLFYKINLGSKVELDLKEELSKPIKSYVFVKNVIALCLVPIFIFLAGYSFFLWIVESFAIQNTPTIINLNEINKIFFNDFFTILILIDVFLLLLSFLHTDEFFKVIRNSGFIISTILLKISFGAEGLLNTVLIVIAVLFGVCILWIHNLYIKKLH